MKTEEAIALQEKLEKAAIAHLRVTARQGNSQQYQEAIRLTQAHWGTPADEALRSINNIAIEKAGAEVYAECELPISAEPLDTLQIVLGVLEIAMKADTLASCKEMVSLALHQAFTQNLVTNVALYIESVPDA